MADTYREYTPEEKELALKPWGELTLEQKVDRLAVVLRSHDHLTPMISTLQHEVNQLKQHQHGTDGKLVLPMFQQGLGGLGGLATKPMNQRSEFNRLY